MSELRHAHGGDCGTTETRAGAAEQYTGGRADWQTATGKDVQPEGRELPAILASLALRRSCRTGIIRFESSKVTQRCFQGGGPRERGRRC